MKNIRVGFLGTGWIAGTHAQALAKLPDVQLVALCNHHIERAKTLNEKFNGKYNEAYIDYQKRMLCSLFKHSKNSGDAIAKMMDY